MIHLFGGSLSIRADRTPPHTQREMQKDFTTLISPKRGKVALVELHMQSRPEFKASEHPL